MKKDFDMHSTRTKEKDKKKKKRKEENKKEKGNIAAVPGNRDSSPSGASLPRLEPDFFLPRNLTPGNFLDAISIYHSPGLCLDPPANTSGSS